MKLWRSEIRLCSAASARACSRLGVTGSSVSSALPAALIEHPLDVAERAASGGQQDHQVVDQVARLFVDARSDSSRAARVTSSASSMTFSAMRVGLASSARCMSPAGARAPARPGFAAARAALVRRRGRQLSAMKAAALPGVTRWARGLHEGEQAVAVAVNAQRAHRLHVAAGFALVPRTLARATPQVQLARLARARERLLIHVGEHQHLSGAPVLHDAGTRPRSSYVTSSSTDSPSLTDVLIARL